MIYGIINYTHAILRIRRFNAEAEAYLYINGEVWIDGKKASVN